MDGFSYGVGWMLNIYIFLKSYSQMGKHISCEYPSVNQTAYTQSSSVAIRLMERKPELWESIRRPNEAGCIVNTFFLLLIASVSIAV